MSRSIRPTFSGFRGGLRVGADFFARRNAILKNGASKKPRGVVDKIADLAHPAIDVTKVHPAIVVFFEDTASLDLLIRSYWRFPFSILWPLFRWVMALIGQFVLPIREGRIATRVFTIDTTVDGRADARGVIRTYEGTDRVMQVVSYATFENEGRRYMSAVFPLPFGSITGILRLDPQAGDARAIRLTSQRMHRADDDKNDDAAVWMVIGAFAFRAPLGEQIELWTPDMKSRPVEIDQNALAGATIVGRHEQRIFGFRFVTHHYWFRPIDRRPIMNLACE